MPWTWLVLTIMQYWVKRKENPTIKKINICEHQHSVTSQQNCFRDFCVVLALTVPVLLEKLVSLPRSILRVLNRWYMKTLDQPKECMCITCCNCSVSVLLQVVSWQNLKIRVIFLQPFVKPHVWINQNLISRFYCFSACMVTYAVITEWLRPRSRCQLFYIIWRMWYWAYQCVWSSLLTLTTSIHSKIIFKVNIRLQHVIFLYKYCAPTQSLGLYREHLLHILPISS